MTEQDDHLTAMLSEVETRIATQAVRFALTDSTDLVTWLEGITGQPVERISSDDEWKTTGPGGITVGLSRGDPITATVQVCMAIAGMTWPFAFPGVLYKTNKLWREARRSKEDGTDG